ncbi:MAG: YCF48-related protein [Pyrinomonadaceae bacterium]|nr:YCF48-related protein [Pyrinomonadaceae bacterium]
MRNGKCFLLLLPSAWLLLTAVFVTTFSLQAFAQDRAWKRQESGSLAWLHSVFFLDQNRGWAVGSKGALLATEDGGRIWKANPRPSEDIIRDIYFSDELNGWVVCERNVYELKTKEDPRTYLMNTTDGGEHWNRVDINGADVDGRLVRAVFSPSGRGWAFGERGAIFTSHDSGANWTKLQAPTRHLLLGGTFIDDYRGWLVGAGATILQTSDGGETWHLSQLPAAKGVRFTATSFVNNRLGWAVGSGGNVYRTINGGRTWQAQTSTVSADLLDVKFLDAVEGWAVGAEGTLIYTEDGGLHWTVEPSGTTHPLERVFFPNRTHGWAVGFGGTILAYVRAEAPRLRR